MHPRCRLAGALNQSRAGKREASAFPSTRHRHRAYVRQGGLCYYCAGTMCGGEARRHDCRSDLRARQELAEIAGILRELERSHLDDPEAKFDIENLGSLVRLHVEHEQEELLPEAAEVLDPEEEDRLSAVAAEEFERLRQRLQA